jgi:uncharacterized cupredoxin-like copper-binding protein
VEARVDGSPGGVAWWAAGAWTRRVVAPVLLPVTAVLGVGGLAACGESAPVVQTGACVPHLVQGEGLLCSGEGQPVQVTLRNFKIEVPAVIPTGAVTFVVHGAGPTLHEFNVARSDLSPKHLPLADDDTVDDTKNTPHFTWIAQVEGIDVGDTKTLTTNIAPGHYVFYCNMDGHYMADMSAEATAR